MNRRSFFASTIAAIAALPVFGARATEAETLSGWCYGCQKYFPDASGMLSLDGVPGGKWLCHECEETYDQPVDDLTALYHEHFGAPEGVLSMIANDHGSVWVRAHESELFGVNQQTGETWLHSPEHPFAGKIVVGYEMEGPEVAMLPSGEPFLFEMMTPTPASEWAANHYFAGGVVHNVKVYWI